MKAKHIILAVAVLVLAGLFANDRKEIILQERYIVEQQKALDRVPTIKELQHKVGAEEDGVVGPNTIALWKKAINNQYAIESFARMAGDKK